MSWQAWCKGVMAEADAPSLQVETTKLPLADEYRFVRRYFHPFWSIFILMIRLLSLHAPWKEVTAFMKSVRVRRINPYAVYKDWLPLFQSFDSSLLKEAPLVSVIIPTLNRYEVLNDALKDLEMQDYQNFEVIVVDQSEPFHSEFYSKFNLDIRIIYQEEKALWLARNTAIKLADGEFIALYEDDIRVGESWLSNHLKCLDYFHADVSAGVFFPAGTSIPESRKFFRWADQFATGNACLKREVFEMIGLFDRQFEKMRMGDGAFGLRVYLNGFKSVSNPLAYCEDLKAPAGGLRQMGSWDAFRPARFWSPRPVPSVLYYVRKSFGSMAACQVIANNLFSSITPYRFKSNKKVTLIFYVAGLLLSPLLLIQAYRSWMIASEMLKIDRIEFLEKK
jgi:glycosyltransferase involved in cell wall biosynthesis